MNQQGNANGSPTGPKPRRPKADTSAFTTLPDAPSTLGECGRREWVRAGNKLVADSRLAPANVGLLEIYCQRHDAFAEASALVAAEGLVAISEKGSPYAHPATHIQASVLSSIERIAKVFGLTPMSEAKLPATTQPFDALEAFKRGE